MKIKKGWIITLVVLMMLIGVGLMVYFAVQAMVQAEPSVKDRTVLVVELTGELPENSPSDFTLSLFEPPALTFQQVLSSIDKATSDKRITGVWLRIESPNLGWSKVEELQNKLTAFKKSGKFIYATTVVCNERDYACALPADKIYMPPEGFFELNGFVAQAMFLKDTLNKFGIDPEVENIGKYKSAGDMLKRNSASDAQREVMNNMLDKTVASFNGMVARYRKIPTEQVATMMEEGLSHPTEAAAHKLIDGILYPDEVDALLREKNGEKGRDRLTTITCKSYRRVSRPAVTDGAADQIAVVYAVGTIIRGKDAYSPLMGRVMGSDTVIESLQKARQNKSVKAIVLRIDSPGGDGIASDLMWRELRITDQKKPVIASMSDVAASGGYYIGMGCRRIVAEPATITGSIGVVNAKFNMKGMYDWLQLRFETVKRGQWADMMDDTRGMTPAERERFAAMTRGFYERFVQKAADSRKKKFAELEPFAQGRVWLGSEAIQHGLVDDLGGLEEAVAIAKKEAGIPAGRSVRLVEYPVPKKLFEQIMESMAETQLAQVHPGLRHDLAFLGRFVLPGPGAMLAVMPYALDIH
ncbi:MAG TPA: signal peptide peptidase SppA [Acidobacteriota bacterium]|nr:signal peptide peptidase SppA [Acidobacteriota bacterium]HQM62825.1 signal peptide peptidase SppA [Acidobacteriota bacterium]